MLEPIVDNFLSEVDCLMYQPKNPTQSCDSKQTSGKLLQLFRTQDPSAEALQLSAQSQKKLPSVFLQSSFDPHGLPKHSSMSSQALLSMFLINPEAQEPLQLQTPEKKLRYFKMFGINSFYNRKMTDV